MEITFRGITYRQVTLAECGVLGDALHAAGTPWHFHVLSPVCLHNPFSGRYALIVENDATRDAWIADAGADFPEIDKHLVRLLHGADILDHPSAPDAPETEGASRLLAHLRALQAAGEAWHHHMHFPGCVFNPHPGKWSISVESEGLLLAEAYDAEPVDVLRQVELAYFENLDGPIGVQTAGRNKQANR